MSNQITNKIIMIKPVAFRMNEETAVNNYYQESAGDQDAEQIQQEALHQFDNLVSLLQAEGVSVTVIQDSPSPATPDSIFPNNWISLHADGQIMLYPMFAENRRLERRPDIVSQLEADFDVKAITSFADWEQKQKYLEGTGSLILDRANKVAYAAISERTMPEVLKDFESRTGFKAITFSALQQVGAERLPIYHTNVMMCVGERFALVCLESIDSLSEREHLIETIEETDKEIIEISEDQKGQFAGNMLQVIGAKDERLIVMSTSAFNALDDEQKTRLATHGRLVHSDIGTIEKLGGGSVRCMLAENFLPSKK